MLRSKRKGESIVVSLFIHYKSYDNSIKNLQVHYLKTLYNTYQTNKQNSIQIDKEYQSEKCNWYHLY
jgi:hypothetical protein